MVHSMASCHIVVVYIFFNALGWFSKEQGLVALAPFSSLVVLKGFLSAPMLRQPYRSQWDHSTVRSRSTCCSTLLAVSNPHYMPYNRKHTIHSAQYRSAHIINMYMCTTGHAFCSEGLRGHI